MVVKIIHLCYSFFIVHETETAENSAMTDETRWNLLQAKAMQVRSVKAFALFREQGIEPILIKGLAAARLYPEPGSRASIDMDLAVSSGDFEPAQKIARSAAANGLAIDLHRELRHLDTVEWKDLFDNSQLIDVEGGTIRVLRHEDHLRVLCVHWLTDGGANKEKLWDIYHGVNNRGNDFDWGRLLGIVSERRRRWLVCAIGVAHHFLGLDLTDTPVEDEAVNIPTWVVKTVQKEWANKIRFRPLETVWNDPKELLQQIPKRLRPNPIWATIEMEGSFDAKTRVFYQVGSFFHRIIPSYRRVSQSIIQR
jgi:hypothetical protein